MPLPNPLEGLPLLSDPLGTVRPVLITGVIMLLLVALLGGWRRRRQRAKPR